MRVTFYRTILALCFLLAGSAYGSAVCPTTIENDPPATADGCGILLTVGPSLNVSISLTGTGAYDGASSSTFGVINNSGVPLSSLALAANGTSLTLFAGNGIRGYIQANDVSIPPGVPVVNGYEDYYGPQTTFSNVDFTTDSLTVDLVGSLLTNGAAYFSLPGDPQADYLELTGPGGGVTVTPAATTVPEIPIAFLILTGLLALASLNRVWNISCKQERFTRVDNLGPIRNSV